MTETVTGKTVVLVVDDEPLILMTFADYFGECGFEPIEALTGDDALSLLSSQSDIDIVFTDVNMPGRLDALALSRLVCSRCPTIRTVVTPARVRPEAADLADHVEFIPKLYDLERVVQLFGADRRRVDDRSPRAYQETSDRQVKPTR
jgi:CheY-like chemotaxis protein